MFLKSIKLTNFLSYGPESAEIELKPLNLIVGPNGSGKSNLLEAFELLRAAPRDLLTPIRDGGGVVDWLWKGQTKPPVAEVNVVVSAPPKGNSPLRYILKFGSVVQRFEIIDENVENEAPYGNEQTPYFYYHFNNGRPVLNVKRQKRQLQREDIDPLKSILEQRKDPDQYPELDFISSNFNGIQLYREWSFGRFTIPRLPQKVDQPNKYLNSDSSNLGLVLNRLKGQPAVKKRLLESLKVLYEGIDDFDVQFEGGTVQVFFHEGRFTVPATRLSDGTLRYLCLLAILCNPEPGPLVCIEEPELGLHPDVLPTLASLLKQASEHTQLIVTTHSDVLVDAMTDTPEAVLVASRSENGTQLERLDAEKLKPWLEDYRLGQLWTRGDIGGTRW